MDGVCTFVSIPSSLWFFCRTCWSASWIFCWSFSTFTFSWSQDRSVKQKSQLFAQTHAGGGKVNLAHAKSNDAVPLIYEINWWRKNQEGNSAPCCGEYVSAFFFFSLSVHREWHLPADINTKAENRAISSSDRCIEHKFFPNSKTELIKSSQPATAKDTERGLRMRKTKEQHSLLIFIGREAHREGRGRGRNEKEAACWQHMGAS